jgi:hypothetical protein
MQPILGRILQNEDKNDGEKHLIEGLYFKYRIKILAALFQP